MTNYEPIKNCIWDAVKKDDRGEFDKQCELLKEKAVGDWWRIGWSLGPEKLEDVLNIIDDLAEAAHKAWIEAMKIGDAPPEDVSPGEGFKRCSDLIRSAISS